MRKIGTYGALLTLLFCGHAAAQGPAGLVAYFKSGNEVFLLLAEHADSQRGWAGFGGGALEGESLAQTAARKAEEESRGYFKQANLLPTLKKQTPVIDGDFAAYFVEVYFAPAPRFMHLPVPPDNDAYHERGAFAWIPYKAVEAYLKADIDRSKKYPIDPSYLPVGSQTQWFWPIWLSNMRQAVLDGAVPW